MHHACTFLARCLHGWPGIFPDITLVFRDNIPCTPFQTRLSLEVSVTSYYHFSSFWDQFITCCVCGSLLTVADPNFYMDADLSRPKVQDISHLSPDLSQDEHYDHDATYASTGFAIHTVISLTDTSRHYASTSLQITVIGLTCGLPDTENQIRWFQSFKLGP